MKIENEQKKKNDSKEQSIALSQPKSTIGASINNCNVAFYFACESDKDRNSKQLNSKPLI